MRKSISTHSGAHTILLIVVMIQWSKACKSYLKKLD